MHAAQLGVAFFMEMQAEQLTPMPNGGGEVLLLL
jgi:hypothetical protein